MITAILGLIIGLAAILLGNTLEGGHLEALVQPTAALIVFGGTMGATLLSTQVGHFSGAIRSLGKVFFHRDIEFEALIQEIVQVAAIARKEGILSLESHLAEVKNPFLRGKLRFVVDGYDPEVFKNIVDGAISHEESEKMAVSKVWETAGGYSPTIGILGAVLGLIHVMSNLSDSSKLGSGIAVAFVATIYGVGAANLVLLPISNRLRGIAKNEVHAMELMQAGLLGIQAGLNPRVIEAQLRSMMGQETTDAPVVETEAKKAA
jgi:chemotaxis protein MotA